MNKTQIEWVRNPDGSLGYTFNPITGCLNNCDYCYARKLANGRLKSRYLANLNIALPEPHDNPKLAFDDPFYPRFWPDKLKELCFTVVKRGETTMLYGRKQRDIFVCNMSDLFGIGVPESWTREILDVIKADTQDIFYLLTNQPQNLRRFGPFPDNCRVGATATDTSMFAEACYRLGKIKAKVKYISFEPLLDFKPREDTLDWKFWISQWLASGINWVIIGACTGTKREMQEICQRYNLTLMPYGKKWTAQPKIEWVKEIVEAADKAGIPVFLKENLKPLLEKENPHECYNGVLGRWKTDGGGDVVFKLRLRRETPK